MSNYSLPPRGASVLVTLPKPYRRGSAPACYTVAGARGQRLTLLSDEQWGDLDAPPGAPCLVRSVHAQGRRLTCPALVVAAGASTLIVDAATDPRRHSRHRRAYRVRIEVLDSDIGVVDGISDDLSVGGMRVRTAIALPPDARAFVTVPLADAAPVLALAEVRGARGTTEADVGHIARLKFTLIAPFQEGRLQALLRWPSDEEQVAAQPRHRELAPAMAR